MTTTVSLQRDAQARPTERLGGRRRWDRIDATYDLAAQNTRAAGIHV